MNLLLVSHTIPKKMKLYPTDSYAVIGVSGDIWGFGASPTSTPKISVSRYHHLYQLMTHRGRHKDSGDEKGVADIEAEARLSNRHSRPPAASINRSHARSLCGNFHRGGLGAGPECMVVARIEGIASLGKGSRANPPLIEITWKRFVLMHVSSR